VPVNAASIIEAVASLLWPLLVAVIVWRLAPHVPGLVAELRRGMRTRAFRVRIGGAELSVEEATEQLRRQVTDLQAHLAAQLAERGEVGRAGGVAAEPAADQGRATVLWVDDRPEANALELAKLQDDGVEVLQARSTAEAMDVLSLRRGVRAIVTGLGRTEDGELRAHAGLALLRQLREAELDQPTVVYTSARGVELDRQEALEAGAAVVTASPTELFAALTRILGASAAAEPERLGPASPPQPPRPGARRPRRPIRPG
jgi:CheY-like chemotaxis protein